MYNITRRDIMDSKIYLTTNDIMRKYSVVRSTVNNWRKEGLPIVRFGRLVRFEAEEVDKWLRNKS